MTTIVDSNLPVARPSWDHSRLESRIVHLGCGAFHRAHQALYTHHLLESTDSDWGICEVNLMPGNDRVLIENLKKQQLLYTVAEKGAESTELKIIGSMKEALHRNRRLRRYSQRDGASANGDCLSDGHGKRLLR